MPAGSALVPQAPGLEANEEQEDFHLTSLGGTATPWHRVSPHSTSCLLIFPLFRYRTIGLAHYTAGNQPIGQDGHILRGLVSPFFLQVFGLVMAWLHWQKLNEIHSQMDTVDFKQLDWSDFNFATLDLTGAGWCWCLPREGGYIPVCDKDDESEVEAATSHSKV